jgi:NifU-like protein involved in Fe-S cluster formation
MARFSEVLREHARYPSNQGAIIGADLTGAASLNGNPPFITFYLSIQNGRITKAGFESAGCGVTTAICSVTTELLHGLTIEECKSLNVDQICEMLDGVPPDKLHCAHVVLKALTKTLESVDP